MITTRGLGPQGILTAFGLGPIVEAAVGALVIRLPTKAAGLNILTRAAGLLGVTVARR